MIASKTIFVLFAAAAAVSARVVPRKNPPAGWWTAGLENYDTYHTRYLALGCQNQHGTSFFDACCHPLKADETLATARPAECIPPASASASASLAEPTSTVTTPDDTSASVSASAVSEFTSPSAISNVAIDDGDDDCEDGGDSSSSAAPESTSPPAPTFIPATSISGPTSAPAPTSTPEPTSTPAASPSTSHKSKSKTSSAAQSTPSSSSSSSSSSSGQTFTGGVATFFYQNGVAGACGTVHSDSDLIAAIDSQRYGNTGDVSSLCGKQVEITNTDNGKTVTVTIADACPTCENENSIDLSTGAFDKIGNESAGVLPISWKFVS